MKKREKFDDKKNPMFVYEVHPVPGKSMNRQKKMRMDSIITERLHMSWQLM